MEQEIVWNAFHHEYWGLGIALYFWLVGASAGSFVLSSLGWVFGIKKYKPMALTASISAIILLLIVPVLLILDLGKPHKFWHLLNPGFWHYSAPMAWGTLLVASYPVSMMIYAWFVYKHNERWAKRLGLAAVTLAIMTHWYTGIVMELSSPVRELNHTAMAPLLFLTGAFISGIALMIIVMSIKNLFVGPEKKTDKSLLIEMGRLMAYGIAFDTFLMFSEFLQMTYGPAEEWATLHHVLLGVLRVPYLYMEIIMALLIPLIILFSPLGKKVPALIFVSVLIDVGIFGMRAWWVLGGQFLQSFY
jgi:Ni/Fe-hydrogenase subunit HybB-like protein